MVIGATEERPGRTQILVQRDNGHWIIYVHEVSGRVRRYAQLTADMASAVIRATIKLLNACVIELASQSYLDLMLSSSLPARPRCPLCGRA